ncbi:hypothetical protein BJ123_12325 [Rhodopseudomonas thermotolerans]|uniref:Uncharacterized protein n=3 Tax=Nitrobacteraceae TaxID=41294 RepID=A0A336JSB4_9BRAD|nr:hypothetical protein BJ125_12325 [Rhodopseudomonas pentothenatexigens]REF91343.1 hypothetical protein BJ123_12325 [Rhodopseudomonas thermotolerans]SSW92675.1 hypothetical protein SAMN05892882_12325 [Rhodopseudomonas pentothenatexigens]
MMDAADFQNLLDRLGDDLSCWPDQQRRDAELLLRDSEDARAAFAEAQRLRRLLSPSPVNTPDGLVDRIMARVRRDRSDPAAPSDAPLPRGRDRDPS